MKDIKKGTASSTAISNQKKHMTAGVAKQNRVK